MPGNVEVSGLTMEGDSPAESQELNSSGVRQRKVIRTYGQAHEPPADDQLYYVPDDNYGIFTQVSRPPVTRFKEGGNVLFNYALNTFYLNTYMVSGIWYRIGEYIPWLF